MAHNRTTQYSAPFRRNSLLGLHQYIASEHFPSLGNWDRSSSDDLYVVKGTSGRCHPVNMTIVAAISSDKAHLQPHGNYDPTYTTIEQMPKKTRLQFVLTSPADDPDFAADYALAIKRLKAIQEDVAASQGPRQHFIDRDNLKMNFLLFEPKEPAEEGPDEDDDSHDCNSERGCEEGEVWRKSKDIPSVNYEVESQYRAQWELVSQTHNNKIMEVYGVDELPVSYKDFHKILVPGTTVAVNFTLKHYAIRGKGSRIPESDTFSAFAESVSVLKAAEKIVKSKTTPKRRPLPVTQLPSRGTLKLAANTFAPVRQVSPSAPSNQQQQRARPDSTRSVAPPASSVPLPQFIEGSSTSTDHSEAPPSTSVPLPQFIEGSSTSAHPFDLATRTFLTRDDIIRLIPAMLDRINNTSGGLEFYDNPTRPPTPMSTNVSVVMDSSVSPGLTEGPSTSTGSIDGSNTALADVTNIPRSEPVRTLNNGHVVTEDDQLPSLMPLSDSEDTLSDEESVDNEPQEGTNFIVVEPPEPLVASPERKRTRSRRA